MYIPFSIPSFKKNKKNRKMIIDKMYSFIFRVEGLNPLIRFKKNLFKTIFGDVLTELGVSGCFQPAI